jgi:hypothetical protein
MPHNLSPARAAHSHHRLRPGHDHLQVFRHRQRQPGRAGVHWQCVCHYGHSGHCQCRHRTRTGRKHIRASAGFVGQHLCIRPGHGEFFGPVASGLHRRVLWALYAVQTPGAPLLSISYSGNQAIVSWSPSATGWTLQTNNNLTTGTWGNYLGQVVNNNATDSPPTGNVFFRLKQ